MSYFSVFNSDFENISKVKPEFYQRVRKHLTLTSMFFVGSVTSFAFSIQDSLTSTHVKTSTVKLPVHEILILELFSQT